MYAIDLSMCVNVSFFGVEKDKTSFLNKAPSSIFKVWSNDCHLTHPGVISTRGLMS